MHCPECVREGRASTPRRRPAILGALRRPGDRPVVTYAIIAITVLVFILQIIPGSPVESLLIYYPPFTLIQPWTLITSIVLHGSIIHLAFNMFSLYIFGPMLEGMLGRARFIALYLVSGLGGSVAVLWLSPATPVLGASGAIFGLMGAFFVIQRRLGGNNLQILIVIGINLVSGFILPGVSWQAHVGGVVTGALIALVYMRTRKITQRPVQIALVAAVVAGLVALVLVRFFVLG